MRRSVAVRFHASLDWPTGKPSDLMVGAINKTARLACKLPTEFGCFKAADTGDWAARVPWRVARRQQRRVAG